jgi:uncharacterized protein
MIEGNLSVPTIDKRQRIPDRVIDEMVRIIADQFHPQKIILFGSYAYGKPSQLSDVDLLVIMTTQLRESQQAMEIRQALLPLFGIDILVYTPEKLRQRIALGDSFLKEITERGVIMYESADA